MKGSDILIIEDELIISEMLKEVINDSGYSNVEQATGYSEALMFLARKKWDLVFLDIHLGEEKDGVDLAHLIQTKYKTPFVFITSYGDSDSIARAVATRPEAYLTKPFKSADIAAVMQLVFSKLSVRKSLRFKEGYVQEEILLSKVLFLKSDNIYVELYTADRTYLIRSTLENFLNDHAFPELLRVHRSYVINTQQRYHLNGSLIVLGGFEIPISRKYKTHVFEQLQVGAKQGQQ